jgi:glycosyltransferase involved in cell wall biosynthesis
MLEQLAQEWQKQGHMVLVLTNKYPYQLKSNERVNDINVKRLIHFSDQGKGIKSFLYKCLIPFQTKSITSLIKAFNPDKVYVQFPSAQLPYLEHVYKTMPNKQWYLNFHGHDILKHFELNGSIENLTLIPIEQPIFSNIFIYLNKIFSIDKTSIGLPFLYFIAYNFWQKALYRFVLRNIDISSFDLIHHLTSISFREPGYLWKINKPFIWGPISGNVKIPDSFASLLTNKQKFAQKIRNIIVEFQLNYSRRVFLASKKANLIYCVTSEDYSHFQNYFPNKIKAMLDVGSTNNFRSELKIEKKSVHFIWIGRVVYSKALSIFLYSIAEHQKYNLKSNVEFTVIGDGPDLQKNIILSKQLNLKNIKFLGSLLHDDVLLKLQQADCLIHTSIREATSATILEALSFGIPVICHNAFGMGIAVNEKCGIKIPFINPSKSIHGFSKAINKIIDDEDLLKELKNNAFKRADELSWKHMALNITNDYEQILNNL